jgi:biotin transport system ATP-binding protein/energy-coupling factor transport system ATP-binding protein
MIAVRDLHFGYENKDKPLLKGINLDIADGEHLAIIGPNGCGKTTLIKLLNALLVPTAGSVEVDGLDSRDQRSAARIRRAVGMVFQNPDNQIVGMTVEEDIAFGPGNLGLSPDVIRERVESSLRMVGLWEKRDRAPYTLSGGEKRLVAVAGVLAMEPRYIALDEPTSYLDPTGRRAVLELIGKLHSSGIGIIQVSHDMEEIVGAQRIIALAGGEIALQGKPQDILTRTSLLREMGLDVPWAAQLVSRLRGQGMDLPGKALTLEEACEEILKAGAARPRRAAEG